MKEIRNVQLRELSLIVGHVMVYELGTSSLIKGNFLDVSKIFDAIN